ncbi:MAG: WXG100 family type VII secretion target [Ardenticatenales bacterium]|nr:WXG100 family type VII secretion target [Ardenticatenales bacterium]
MAFAAVIQVNYERLETISQQFAERAELVAQLRAELSHRAAPLREGGWQGEGALAFFNEMDSEILPATQRLQEALHEASDVTLKISEIVRAAEEEAAALFTNGTSGESAVNEKGFWGHAGDFFSGMWAEGKDMVTGIWTAVTNPVDTAKGLWYGITHPGELWNAIKAPYVEDWNNGRPWRAIGRGTMALVTTVLGTKGADKLAKVARGATVVDDVARVATVTDDVARVSTVADDIGRVTTLSDDAARLGTFSDEAATAGSKVTPNPALRNNPHANAHGFSARDINPGYPTTGRVQNCVKCVQAMDDLLSGNGARIAPTTTGPLPISQLSTKYGTTWQKATQASIESTLTASGHGSRGIVYVRWQSGGGHVFNVVNQKGVIRFIDAQTGKSGLGHFSKPLGDIRFLPTN